MCLVIFHNTTERRCKHRVALTFGIAVEIFVKRIQCLTLLETFKWYDALHGIAPRSCNSLHLLENQSGKLEVGFLIALFGSFDVPRPAQQRCLYSPKHIMLEQSDAPCTAWQFLFRIIGHAREGGYHVMCRDSRPTFSARIWFRHLFLSFSHNLPLTYQAPD